MELSLPSPDVIFFIASDVLCRPTFSVARRSLSPDVCYRPTLSVACLLGFRRGLEQSLPSSERRTMSPAYLASGEGSGVR